MNLLTTSALVLPWSSNKNCKTTWCSCPLCLHIIAAIWVFRIWMYKYGHKQYILRLLCRLHREYPSQSYVNQAMEINDYSSINKRHLIKSTSKNYISMLYPSNINLMHTRGSELKSRILWLYRRPPVLQHCCFKSAPE